MSALRVAIVGCGKISVNHATAVHAFQDAELTAFCDPELGRAEALRDRFGTGAVYSDFSTLLAEQSPDVVCICTPHPTHEKLVLEAVAAGAHVLCEKPLAVELDSAQRMIDAARDAGVRLGVLFQRRYWPAARRIRAAIDDGLFGTPVLGECTVQLGRDRAYFEADAWRGKWSTEGGGVLMNQGIHYIDLLQWFLGPARTVTGHISTFRHGDYIEVEDTAVATVEFTSGALATIRATSIAAPGLGARVAVTGDNGATASITEFPEGQPACNDVWAVLGQEEYALPWDPAIDSDPPLSAIHERLMPYHRLQVEEFLTAIAADRAPEIDGVSASHALQIVQAIYESSRTGRKVRLAD
ncbi:Gfo/Idh/MocA family oxidoreductase [Saccharopolyspora sp. NPDC002686]|uniref:Gfo/Idh/MocA family protein n=1 Tax=Saccharopolyspora sp. NPDC002686 TaxID=3154541 RepID=UPI00331FB478